jgi:hypothetical protein
MRKLLLSFLLAAGAIAPAPAQQAAPPAATSPGTGEIVVEGQRTPKRAIDKFVQDLTPARIGGQLGRFEDPVCPVALGMDPRENDLVRDRLRQVAAAVGMTPAPGRCVPNLYVLVGRDKKEIIEGLKRQFPTLLSGLPGSAVRDLIDLPGPVASWQILDRVGADGMPLSSARMSNDATPIRVVSTVGSPSRLAHLTKVKFVATLIVVEARALNGVTTRQLADYAAMRTFAGTDPARKGQLPARSILSLFSPATPGDAPPSVTWWDFAFLKSLYASSGELAASGQRSEMRKIVAKELSKVPPEER